MERKTASDFDQELLNLFDAYVHGDIDRRGFLDRATQVRGRRRDGGDAARRAEPELRRGAAGAEGRQAPQDRVRSSTRRRRATGKMRGYLAMPASAQAASCRACWSFTRTAGSTRTSRTSRGGSRSTTSSRSRPTR